MMKLLFTLFIFSTLGLYSQGWNQIMKIDTVRYIEILNYGTNTYLFTNDNFKLSVQKSSDEGETWDILINHKNPVGETEFPTDVNLVNENIAYIAFGKSGNIYKYNFLSNDVTKFKIDANSYINSMKMINENYGVCANSSELFITKDGWQTSNKIEVKKLEEVYCSLENGNPVITYLTYDELDDKISRFYRSLDEGKNWSETDLGDFNILDVVIKENSDILITARKNEKIDNTWTYKDLIFKSIDRGKTWENKLNKTKTSLVDLDDIKFFNNEIGIAAGKSTSTYITFDGGETWSEQQIGNIAEQKNTPTFCGFSLTKFLIGVWNDGLYEKSIVPTSVTQKELQNKYKHTIVDGILSFQNQLNPNYSIYNLNGRLENSGHILNKLNLNNLPIGLHFINLNNEYVIKYLK